MFYHIHYKLNIYDTPTNKEYPYEWDESVELPPDQLNIHAAAVIASKKASPITVGDNIKVRAGMIESDSFTIVTSSILPFVHY